MFAVLFVFFLSLGVTWYLTTTSQFIVMMMIVALATGVRVMLSEGEPVDPPKKPRRRPKRAD